LSAPMMCYATIASQLFILAIADPLSEPTQKTDSLCLPNLELLSFAIADPFSALTNLADSFGLLICDRPQTISTDSIGDIGTYNVRGQRLAITLITPPSVGNSPLHHDCCAAGNSPTILILRSIGNGLINVGRILR
jgi:hypothetical protein